MLETTIDFAHFKAKLYALAERTERLAKQVDAAAQTVELDQNRVGRLSRIDAMQGQAMAKASSERQQLQRQAIRRALERIDSGEFGRCLGCDEYIASARLEVDPTALHCITCAEQSERR